MRTHFSSINVPLMFTHYDEVKVKEKNKRQGESRPNYVMIIGTGSGQMVSGCS